MRIAYLAPRVDMRAWSADTVHISEVVRAWRGMDHDVTIFSSRLGRNDGMERTVVPDLRVVDRQTLVPIADLAELAYLGPLLKHATKFRPDIVYLRYAATPLVAKLAAGLFGARLFVEVNGLHEVEAPFLARRREVFAAVHRLDGIGFRAADGIVAVTPEVKEHLVRRYRLDPELVAAVPNGANTALFHPMPREECRARLGLPPSRPLVLFVGELSRWQGVDQLLRAAPLVLRQSPDTLFLIVGRGAARGEWEALADELGVSANVRFVGSVPHFEVPTYVGACDVAVSPKRPLASSTSPLKLFEYLACGRPVVATDLPGFRILVEHNAGQIVPQDKPETFATALVTLLRDPEARARMGANGRALVERDYSWASVAARIAAKF